MNEEQELPTASQASIEADASAGRVEPREPSHYETAMLIAACLGEQAQRPRDQVVQIVKALGARKHAPCSQRPPDRRERRHVGA
jgi:hypothetical protein